MHGYNGAFFIGSLIRSLLCYTNFLTLKQVLAIIIRHLFNNQIRTLVRFLCASFHERGKNEQTNKRELQTCIICVQYLFIFRLKSLFKIRCMYFSIYHHVTHNGVFITRFVQILFLATVVAV